MPPLSIDLWFSLMYLANLCLVILSKGFEEFISFASGKKTKSEILNLGRHEFAPWQIGITG